MPSLSTRNFSKFHCSRRKRTGPESANGPRSQAQAGGKEGGAAHLDAGEAEDARLLRLEPLVHLVRVVAVDVRLGHEREGHAVVDLAELGDLLVALGLLAGELGCARASVYMCM